MQMISSMEKDVIILSIETATRICSVSLSKNGINTAHKISNTPNAHSSLINKMIRQLMDDAGMELSALDAVAVSKGPGSYTGLRIGVSTAKGICYALDIPLLAVDSLQALAYALLLKQPELENESNVLLSPMIDARRMEVYTALFDSNMHNIKDVYALIVDEKIFSEYLKNNKIYFFGDGAEKCRPLFERDKHACFPDQLSTSEGIARPAYEKFLKGHYEDTAYFEPFYLKEFIAGKPKVKGLE